jgi:hypothetical protein
MLTTTIKRTYVGNGAWCDEYNHCEYIPCTTWVASTFNLNSSYYLLLDSTGPSLLLWKSNLLLNLIILILEIGKASLRERGSSPFLILVVAGFLKKKKKNIK